MKRRANHKRMINISSNKLSVGIKIYKILAIFLKKKKIEKLQFFFGNLLLMFIKSSNYLKVSKTVFLFGFYFLKTSLFLKKLSNIYLLESCIVLLSKFLC